MTPRLFVGALCALVAAATPLAVTPPEAAADGLRCTIVGTQGDDVLRGTPGPDVICGLRGNDRLVGRDGNDVLRGGRGRDLLEGGDGRDRLLGGIKGDELVGGAGDDEVVGGGRGDRVLGGAGNDVVVGGPGNDYLDGGPLADVIDGGGGTNTCVVDAQDVVERCVHDEQAPAAVEISVSHTVVDVTEGDASVSVTVHATDDTGVAGVSVRSADERYAGASLRRVSGDRLDGWWEGTITIRRYALPGSYEPRLRISDRVGRVTTVQSPFALTVLDENPDTTLPVVTELATPLPDAVFDHDADDYDGVPLRVHVTDDLSGVSEVVYWATIFLPNGDHHSFSSNLERTSGTALDGVWEGKAWLGTDAYGGTYSLMFFVIDRTNQETYEYARYAGPTSHERLTYYPSHPIPDGRGDFTVLGRQMTDVIRPSITDATATPMEVSTLTGPARVTFSVDVTDVGTGVESVRIALDNPAVPDLTLVARLGLASGNRHDGTWTGHVDLPQGAPPGRYIVTVRAWDFDTNFTSREGDRLPSQPVVTVIDDSP